MASSTAKPVFVVTGPSGAGKGTLIQLVLPRFEELALAVSATTRPQRPGEEDGVHYWFLGREEFDRRVVAGDFLEWVDYVGNRYGTLNSEIDRCAARGARRCSNWRPTAPCGSRPAFRRGDDLRDRPGRGLERRLRERATESSGVIDERLATPRAQLQLQNEFDFVVRNDDKQQAADDLAGIIARTLDGAATMARP